MLLIQALAFFGFPSKVDGCPSFSSWGLGGAAVVVVEAMVKVLLVTHEERISCSWYGAEWCQGFKVEK